MAGTLANLRQSGWLHALFVAVIAYPLGNIAARLGVAEFNAHPIAYAAVSMLAAAISLMIGAKPGPLGNDTLRQPATWLYGVLNTLAFTFAVWVAVYVSATQVSLLTCVPIVMVYLLSGLFLGQRITRQEYLGLFFIGTAVIYLLTRIDLPTASLIQLSLLLVVLGLAQALQKIVAERHKTNRAAHTFHQNMRVTAVVMGVTSSMFIFVFLLLAYLKSLSETPIWTSAPTLDDFLNWHMFLLALVIGMLIRAPSKYCEFLATKKISAKYFLAITSIQPLFTAIYEMCLDRAHISAMTSLTQADIIAMAVTIGGSMLLALSGLRTGGTVSPDAQSFILDPRINETVQQTINLTLTFTKGNQPRAAKLLGLDTTTLKNILADHNNQLQFTRDLVRNIQRHFANNVAMADPLTGLANRLQFTTALTAKLKGRGPVYVVLVDLNKFKPVNDTYGHAAGDAVLQAVAKRLKKLAPKGSVVARLGGDEFALFSASDINTKAIKAKLAMPYKTKFGHLLLSAAVGTASSAKDGKTPEALLAAADKRLYANK